MLPCSVSIQLCHLFGHGGMSLAGLTHLGLSFRCVCHTKIAPCRTRNVVLRVHGINVILPSCQEIFDVINKLKHNKEKRIRTIEVIGTLQMAVLMDMGLQISKMMLLSIEEIFRRANIKMLVDTIDNGVNARES